MRSRSRIVVGLMVVIGLALIWTRSFREPVRIGQLGPTARMEFGLLLVPGIPGQSMPVIVTGRSGAANLLFVRYLSPRQVVFGYDSWGAGGPVSAPVEIDPGRLVPLIVQLPEALQPGDQGVAGRLRIEFGSRVLLDEKVRHHGYAPDEIYFGHNPVGGTVTDAPFAGRIVSPSGETINRDGNRFWSACRAGWRWIRRNPATAGLVTACMALVGAGVLLLVARAVRAGEGWDRPVTMGRKRPPHLVFGLVAAGCVALFAAAISGGTFRLIAAESFSRFYDDQAASLLQGRLDVPPAALDNEAFIFEGKFYGYFGPTPALLRIPLVLAGVQPGRLSRAFMVLYFAASLVAAYALLTAVARLSGGPGAWPSRLQVVLLTAGAGLGSTLFFLGSRAYIYHEAILCGAAFALWSVVACLRWLRARGAGWAWLPALGAGWLAVHARPPAGLFALSTLGCTAAFLLFRGCFSAVAFRAGECARLAGVGLLAVVGVLSFNGLGYLKFRTFEGSPLRYNVQYSPERLRHIEGRSFHLANLPYGLAGYGALSSAVVRPTFPYLFIRYTEPSGFPGARIDLAENTLAIPWAMPALTLLALAGFLIALLRWHGAAVPLLILAGGFMPMGLAMLMAVAQSHRYTADFVPFLVGAATFGLAGADTLAPSLRRALLAATAGLTPVAAAVTLAITVQYQGEVVWGVDPEIKARFLDLRRWCDRALGLNR